MKRIGTIAMAIAMGAVALATSAGPAAADTTPVDYTCDLPSGATGGLAGQIPDTVAVDDLEVIISDSPDPVVQGRTVHYELAVPFPDLTGNLPALGFPLGYFYVKQIDITQPIPAGLDLATVTAGLSPDPNWASVTKSNGNLVVHVQSAVAGSRIRVNPDVTPATIEIEESAGHWIPLDFIPSVDIDAIVTGAPGSSIVWRAPSLVAKVKYYIDILFGTVIHVDWNDVDTPCTPNDPTQIIVSTLVASPAMTVALTRTETAATVGDVIHYEVAITNSGDVPLTGISVALPDATCATPPSVIVVGAPAATVACTHTTTAGDIGTYIRSATVDTAETAATTTNTVSVLVDATRRPDAAVGVGAAGPFTGSNIYADAVTTGQTRSANVARGATRAFTIQIGNDGGAVDSFTVKGRDSGASGYTVSYFSGADNITPQVVAGTYQVTDLAPGATTTIKVKIKATNASAGASTHNADVTVASVVDPTEKDKVRARAVRT